MSGAARWLFADQLGPHFLDDHEPEQPVVLIESKAVFRRRRFHRAKAHLILSALRHRAAELGDRALFVRAETYREGLRQVPGNLEVVHPTSWSALRFVQGIAPQVQILPARGFVATAAQFADWERSRQGRRLLLEDFYRDARRRTGLLMDGEAPEGGRWNFDADNREPPPRGQDRLPLPEPTWPREDDIDAEVRDDLDRWQAQGIGFVGRDGPRRFAVTAAEAGAALRDFTDNRLALFGRYEDAMLAGDPWMAHSLLSVPLNLGLLDPLVAARAVEREYREGRAPLAAAEGFIRQVIGWRDYVWHLYWHFGEEYGDSNTLGATGHLPQWWQDLAADDVAARCLSQSLGKTRDYGWAHHIERLMVLGSWALQRGYHPRDLTDWFRRCYVDGFDWVMAPNVIGMSQYADGGILATKPYTSGGSYIKRMSDSCTGCRYRPGTRLGEDACPFTAGYWAFLARNADALGGNHRMARPLAGMARLGNLPFVVRQEDLRGDAPP